MPVLTARLLYFVPYWGKEQNARPRHTPTSMSRIDGRVRSISTKAQSVRLKLALTHSHTMCDGVTVWNSVVVRCVAAR